MSEQKVVTIEKVVFGGKGLSRDLHKIVFVPFTLPGEKVRIQITRERRDYLEAEAIEIIEPSPARVSPDCPYFGRCGGCQLSHANYEAQLALKKKVLEETLQRNQVAYPEIQMFSAAPLAYRHRATLKYDAKHRRLGFYEMQSHHVIDIQECLCLTPRLNTLIKVLRNSLAKHPAPKLTEIHCFENDQGETALHFNAAIPEGLKNEMAKHATLPAGGEKGLAPLLIRFRDYQFPVQADIFLQVNPQLWKAMIQEVESHHPKNPQSTAVEFYSGAGFLTLPLSERFGKIVAYDENAVAIAWAQRRYGASNIVWRREKAENALLPPDAEVAIVDPPRTGLAHTLVARFLAHPLKKISYVSCDCPSFARDAKLLSEKFSIRRIALLDLFPQTFHFEVIALFERG